MPWTTNSFWSPSCGSCESPISGVFIVPASGLLGKLHGYMSKLDYSLSFLLDGQQHVGQGHSEWLASTSFSSFHPLHNCSLLLDSLLFFSALETGATAHFVRWQARRILPREIRISSASWAHLGPHWSSLPQVERKTRPVWSRLVFTSDNLLANLCKMDTRVKSEEKLLKARVRLSRAAWESSHPCFSSQVPGFLTSTTVSPCDRQSSRQPQKWNNTYDMR